MNSFLKKRHTMTQIFADCILPVGTVIPFAGEIGQTAEHYTDIKKMGWLFCDGSEYSIAEYPLLFTALGYLYGGKADKFNVPDLRGQFLRGVGKHAGSLEDRTAPGTGEQNGVGSSQLYAVQKHIHVYSIPTSVNAIPNDKGSPFSSAVFRDEISGPPSEGFTKGDVKVSNLETRSSNVFINFIIKCRY